MKIKIFVYELIRLLYWYPVRFFLLQIPIAFAHKIASLILPLYYFTAKWKREVIIKGLATIYGGTLSSKEINNIVYKGLNNSLKSSIEQLLYPKLNKVYCEKKIEYIGLENLDNAFEAGRGVILLHGHFGNPHLIMPAIGYKGYKLSQIASRNPPEKVDCLMKGLVNLIRHNIFELATASKEELPATFIYIDQFLRAPFEALKRNEVIAISMDGREGVKFVEIKFLKHRALFYTGAMRLIMKTKPVVLPTFHIRNRDNTHKIIIEKPMEIEGSVKNEKDIIYNIKNFLEILQEYVYEYPWLYTEAFCIKDAFLLKFGKKI